MYEQNRAWAEDKYGVNKSTLGRNENIRAVPTEEEFAELQDLLASLYDKNVKFLKMMNRASEGYRPLPELVALLVELHKAELQVGAKCNIGIGETAIKEVGELEYMKDKLAKTLTELKFDADIEIQKPLYEYQAYTKSVIISMMLSAYLLAKLWNCEPRCI